MRHWRNLALDDDGMIVAMDLTGGGNFCGSGGGKSSSFSGCVTLEE
jgi:hypothetical protein